jgi:hypothetical protein
LHGENRVVVSRDRFYDTIRCLLPGVKIGVMQLASLVVGRRHADEGLAAVP